MRHKMKAPEWQKVLGMKTIDTEVPEVQIDALNDTGEATDEELAGLDDTNSINIDGKRTKIDTDIPF